MSSGFDKIRCNICFAFHAVAMSLGFDKNRCKIQCNICFVFHAVAIFVLFCVPLSVPYGNGKIRCNICFVFHAVPLNVPYGNGKFLSLPKPSTQYMTHTCKASPISMQDYKSKHNIFIVIFFSILENNIYKNTIKSFSLFSNNIRFI